MKNLILVLFVIIAFFAGCSDDSSFEPNVNEAKTVKTMFTLPERTNLSVEASTAKLIYGPTGGELTLDGNFTTLENSQINFNIETVFPEGSFPYAETVTVTVSNFAGVDFHPSVQFSEPVLIDMEFIGLDLSGVNPNDVEFGYVAPNGSYQIVPYESLVVNIAAGKLAVTNAQLSHFSRYAFLR